MAKKNSKKDIDKLSEKRIQNENSNFAVIEAYKIVRTNLIFALPEAVACKTILVTSSGAGEGKTTNSINLAITFAQTGAKVLLIDADLRKPKVNKYLKTSNRNGLSNFLCGMAKFSEIIQEDREHNIQFITAGKIPPNPAELLSSERMKVLLEQLPSIYDYIIIDAPPVLVVTDATVMSPYVDGVVLVVRRNSSLHKDVSLAINQLKVAGAKICGFLLTNTSTDSNNGKGGYYYKYKE